jgi:diguanylate cyclase (GGDEF)-like protein
MGETRRSRAHLLAVAAVCYGLVFAGLCLLDVPAIGIAAYFVIPTALVAIASGPVAGGAAAVVSMFLVLAGGLLNPSNAVPATPWLSTSGRMVALLATGLLVGWFAARNRALVAELRVNVERDHLTGLGNYRFYEAAVERRLDGGKPFTLLLCDMDQLKGVNDGQGHSAGDEALRTLAANLRLLTRAGDEIARIGGDEFCVVTTVRTPEEAIQLSSRLERELAKAGCPATFGWASQPFDAQLKVDLFKVADERLYARKTSRDKRLHAVSR